MSSVLGTALVTGVVVAWDVFPCVLLAPYRGAPRTSSLRPVLNGFRLYLTQQANVDASESLVTHVLNLHLFIPLGERWNIMVSKLMY